MGMFDYITFENKVVLPVPENFNMDLKTFEFQTKSLDRAMFLYTIGNDGFLYQENYIESVESTEKTVVVGKPLRKKVDFHGMINFGAYHTTDLVDYSLEYEAKFTDGVLQSIKLLSFDKYTHQSRSESMKELLERVEKRKNSWSYKTAMLLQKLLIVYPLKLFRSDFSAKSIGIVSSDTCTIAFYKPRFFKTKINTDYTKEYSLFLETSNEISQRKYASGNSFKVKCLGFGFSIDRHSKDLFNYE